LKNDRLSVRLVELLTGEEICELPGDKPAGDFRIVTDPEGNVLASGDGKQVLVWDLQALPGYKVRNKAELSAEELQLLWQDLQAKPPVKGYRAQLQLAQGGKGVVQFLQSRLAPAPVPDAKEIRQLIKDLDAGAFVRRERALKTLTRLGPMAAPELQQALDEKPPLEVQRRLEQLLERLREKDLPPAELRNLRAVAALERIGSDKAGAVLRGLAAGGSWSEALERLVKRNERRASSP